jgi:hypothetical protein
MTRSAWQHFARGKVPESQGSDCFVMTVQSVDLLTRGQSQTLMVLSKPPAEDLTSNAESFCSRRWFLRLFREKPPDPAM